MIDLKLSLLDLAVFFIQSGFAFLVQGCASFGMFIVPSALVLAVLAYRAKQLILFGAFIVLAILTGLAMVLVNVVH